MTLLKAAWRDRRGAVAIEYALIGGLVSVAVVAGLLSYTGSVDAMFTSVSTALQDSATPPAEAGD